MRRIATFVILAIAATFFGAYLARDSWQEAKAENQKAVSAHQEMMKEESQRVLLIRQKSELESEAGREKVARDRGYMKPGETALP